MAADHLVPELWKCVQVDAQCTSVMQARRQQHATQLSDSVLATAADTTVQCGPAACMPDCIIRSKNTAQAQSEYASAAKLVMDGCSVYCSNGAALAPQPKQASNLYSW